MMNERALDLCLFCSITEKPARDFRHRRVYLITEYHIYIKTELSVTYLSPNSKGNQIKEVKQINILCGKSLKKGRCATNGFRIIKIQIGVYWNFLQSVSIEQRDESGICESASFY